MISRFENHEKRLRHLETINNVKQVPNRNPTALEHAISIEQDPKTFNFPSRKLLDEEFDQANKNFPHQISESSPVPDTPVTILSRPAGTPRSAIIGPSSINLSSNASPSKLSAAAPAFVPKDGPVERSELSNMMNAIEQIANMVQDLQTPAEPMVTAD